MGSEKLLTEEQQELLSAVERLIVDPSAYNGVFSTLLVCETAGVPDEVLLSLPKEARLVALMAFAVMAAVIQTPGVKEDFERAVAPIVEQYKTPAPIFVAKEV